MSDSINEDVKQDILDALEASLTKTTRKTSPVIIDAHPADLAESLQSVEEEQRQLYIEQLPGSVLSDVFPYFEETVREQVVQAIDNDRLAAAIQSLETDDAIELLDDMTVKDQQELLEAIPASDRLLLEETLNFPEESAGRLMQRDVLSVPNHWTVGEAIDFMRQNKDLPDHFYMMYLIDIRHQVTGGVALSALLRQKRDIKLQEIAETDLKILPATADQEEVAYLFRKYGLISLPIIDAQQRLAGVVMVDDVLDLIEDEAEEDILRLAGVGEHSDFYRSSWRMVRSRASWLMINLLTAILASLVISSFEAEIQQLVALAVLLPIVASMGGNAGMQTLTVMIRAIAMRQVDKRNMRRVIGQEVMAGLMNGAIFAVATGAVAWIWFDSLAMGLVVAAAMVLNLLAASIAGALIPLGLRRIGADPAIASGVFLTTVTDVIGFFAVLGLAALFLL